MADERADDDLSGMGYDDAKEYLFQYLTALKLAEKQPDADPAEIARMRANVESMKRQLPGIKARQRSIDPDLLEEQFKILLNKGPYGPNGGD